jgi:hypothetical protein
MPYHRLRTSRDLVDRRRSQRLVYTTLESEESGEGEEEWRGSVERENWWCS